MDWLAPAKWRRTIKSSEFVQTLIVNGDKVFDQHSDDYLPLGLETLAQTMVDPRPILQAYHAGDRQVTKANGGSSESGLICYDPKRSLCARGRYGMLESVEIAGHSIDLMSYENFAGKRIARRINYTVSVGDFQTAVVTELSSLKKVDESLFAIAQPTPAEARLKNKSLSEAELRSLAVEMPEIVWPQVLDGAETGNASFYLGIDHKGRVREVLPIKTANERSNDSAIRQIMRWKFKPAIENGIPEQVEGVMNFSLNTRKYGPSSTLEDAQLRKLASNMAEPIVPREKAPPGTEYKLWIAVDSDGVVIEKIVASGPSDIFGEVDQALKQWHFQPIMENGHPMPYRGLLVFRF
ncbi:MAG TPA: hypothetical protein VIM62_01125 [Acidobacteriaceae bacterium]